MDDIEWAIDEELRKLNLDPSEHDSEDSEDDFTDDLHAEAEPPDSLITYIEASRNRMNHFEQLILEDIEEKELSNQGSSQLNHNGNLINKLASDFDEDPIKWKESVISEFEKVPLEDVETRPQDEMEISLIQCKDDITGHDICAELNLEWRELEKRLKEEEEQKLAEQKVERELNLNSAREEEEKRRRRQREFVEELKKIEEINVGAKNKTHHIDDLQLELDKQQELIKKLEEEMEKERRAFEKAQEEERKRTQEIHCKAATKIQAAFRGILVRQWSKTELRRKRDEKKRKEEERKELEKMKKEREEERKRIEEAESRQRDEILRRKADYEKAKEQERHRMEREEEQQRRKEVEEKERRKEMERRRKEEQDHITRVEKSKVKEDRRQEEEVAQKERERRDIERNGKEVVKNKRKGEIEDKGGNKNKDNEAELRKIEENETKKDMKRGKTVLEKEKNKMEKMDKSISELKSNSEILEECNDKSLQTKSDKDKVKSHQEKKRNENDGELDSHINLPQPKRTSDVSTTSPESHINEHQEVLDDHDISSVGFTGPTDLLSVEETQSTDTKNTQPISVESEVDTRGHQNATAIVQETSGSRLQELSSICLPDSTEQKRLAWMMNCTPWSKLSLQNKRKKPSTQLQSQKTGRRRKRVPSLPPLPVDTVLKNGEYSSLRQVTTLTLEDLPGYGLSTLSECSILQILTLRRCGLKSLDGLNQCAELRYIDVQENSITHVDCGGLANLQVLLLGRNQLTCMHGLDSAENLHVLQLSHNNISHISGLGSLKLLQRLSVDHNQLLSTRGLNEIYTLLHLDCSYNHLSHVEGLENCALLNTLDLRGNSLTELPVLNNHVLLRDLYLDDNLLSSLQYLESDWLPLLQNLSVAQNSITHLIPLLDLVSLKTLDISHNCLSDLQNTCLNLQGCTGLQELNLIGNPLQHESNWRSLLLETVPGLIKVNNEQTAVTAVPPTGSGQQWSFLALCQAQQEQRNSLLQHQKMEISSAPTQHDAHLLASSHHAELFRLAVEQRYAHEYGDSGVTQDPSAASATDSGLHHLCDASKTKEQRPETQSKYMEDWEKQNPQKTNHYDTVSQTDLELQSNDLQTDSPETPTGKEPAHKLNTKIAAAVVIQRLWRRCILQRQGGLSGLIERNNGGSNIHKIGSPQLHKRDQAAVVIQAVWRGYVLRRRLARALAAAQITESDEDFEELDMDEFIFDEETLEEDWITPHSDASPARTMPFSEQLFLPKPPLPVLMPLKTPSVYPRQPKHAWSDSDGTACFEQNMSPHISSRNSTLSERSEKLCKEWGFTSDSTALLMLKRANKMKGRKQQQKRLLVRQAEKEVQNARREEQRQNYKEKTYQWLHTQEVYPQTDSAYSGRDHFLPEIDRNILNGRRVQLVASSGCRDGVDSGIKLLDDSAGVSPPYNQHTRARRHSSEHTQTDIPSPSRVTSAPTRKERISFRDNPVRQSGGWGGGKKRAKVNK